ncbi:MAG: bifunctional diguanylate cyclase/phosphodiesterase, partial [Nocardioidaceae bacterium]|nr:bifunctional diguanylate cyclase/phosphodiesterase [Nocardioidaceae bacterium]
TDTRATITRLVWGLVGLYAVLALISWWTTRSLRRHAADHEYRALHDPMTGLPNRELFRRVTEDALEHGRSGDRGALVLVDLDHFKEVNDTLGHHAGDELLRIVGQRLSDSLRTDDTVARLGGDEFGMVLPQGGNREETVALLTRVRRELGEEITLDGVTLTIEASFGVCFYPEDADTVEGLLQHADAAMYQGKHGPTGIVIYEPAATRPVSDALVMQRELRQALGRDELVLYYQPKIELGSGRVCGVEALVRWEHPVRGLLPPAEFLPVAERCELIEPLTTWVLRRALADYTAWTTAGHDWTVAVNVSARNLSSLLFADSVRAILQEAGVRPDRLHLEVTETALAFDSELAGQVVGALSAQGISVSIDDFGIGFTGLSQLRTLDVAELKIDRKFISGLPGNDADRAIVRSVIDLGHRLGCVVTAEGVEMQEVADWLVAAGCDHGQGYLWLRPSLWTQVARALGPVTPHAGSGRTTR